MTDEQAAQDGGNEPADQSAADELRASVGVRLRDSFRAAYGKSGATKIARWVMVAWADLPEDRRALRSV